MNACTFFGHRDTPKNIEPILQSTLIDLVENKEVDLFFVGNQGAFDNLVRKNLRLLKLDYPEIIYQVVLDYLPAEESAYINFNYMELMFPEELARVPRKFSIHRRNMWMIKNSDYLITYVTRITGGAAEFMEIAEKQRKTVINLADLSG